MNFKKINRYRSLKIWASPLGVTQQFPVAHHPSLSLLYQEGAVVPGSWNLKEVAWVPLVSTLGACVRKEETARICGVDSTGFFFFFHLKNAYLTSWPARGWDHYKRVQGENLRLSGPLGQDLLFNLCSLPSDADEAIWLSCGPEEATFPALPWAEDLTRGKGFGCFQDAEIFRGK